MATIQNSAIIQKLIDELELYPALDKIPTELADKILPVFQINEQDVNVVLKEGLKQYKDKTLNDIDKTFVVPDGKQWTIKNLSIVWSATATVGLRLIRLFICDKDGDVIYVLKLDNSTIANEVKTIIFSNDNGLTYAANVLENGEDDNQMALMPKDIKVLEGGSVRVYDSASVDVNDDFVFNLIVDEQSTE